jgi:DNA-binding NarL/FixJ family response regulator
LQKLGSAFVILVEGQLLDSVKCAQLTQLDQARLILCDRPAKQNSLLLALNCNSSYISLEHNDPQNLLLVISCALIGGVFICPQAKKKLNNCVFQSKLEQRQAVESLAPIDRKILALAAQGHNYSSIGEQINYSALNIGYRLKNIVQKLNLQTKQEAIALATSIGLSFNSSESELQEA